MAKQSRNLRGVGWVSLGAPGHEVQNQTRDEKIPTDLKKRELLQTTAGGKKRKVMYPFHRDGAFL